MKKPIRIANTGFRAFAGLMLLLCYLAGNNEVQTFHKFFHRHDPAARHSEEEESNACHRSIFHNDIGGCGHQAHISGLEQCDICDLFLNTDQIVTMQLSPAVEKSLSSDSETFFRQVLSETTLYTPSRAPPAVS